MLFIPIIKELDFDQLRFMDLNKFDAELFFMILSGIYFYN